MSSERQRRYERRRAALAADVGEIPPVKDPARRERCRLDLHRFLVEYFPLSTGLNPFSPDHCRAIGRIQGCALGGGKFAQAFPRGYAKTTISENSCCWATLYGHRKFVPIFGATAADAAGNIDSIKLELAENDLLLEDFPEVCHPIRKLEGKSQRCASQTYQVPCNACGGVEGAEECNKCGGAGFVPVLTHIEWTGDTIVLPTLQLPKGWGTPGFDPATAELETTPSSGAILTARGLTGAARGMKHKRPDGTQQRPDFILIDDPQTDESASTPLQVNKRLDTIRKGILKLGGHTREIAVVMNATVIRPDDLVEIILDPKRSPGWQGERNKMVRQWATAHETLWLADYQTRRNSFDPTLLGDQKRAQREATEFYRRNRAKMDAGCEVTWEHCFDPVEELSAIQHAYNLLIDDGPDVFASECQNEPQRQGDGDADATLTAGEIADKTGGLDKRLLPAGTSHVVAFIDVGKHLLYWGVGAFDDDFGGSVVDYGTFPDQKRSYFASRDAKRKLQKVTGTDSLEAAIYAGLDAAVSMLMEKERYKRDGDGAELPPELIVIDANWGDSTDVVYEFCRQSPHRAILLPSHGRYVGARSRPFSQYRNVPGDRVGLNWRMPNVRGRRAVRYLIFDSNWWKTFLFSRLRAAKGTRGCLSLFGEKPEEHRLFADHLTAERPTAVSANGRTVTEWQARPGQDNHYLDVVTGILVAASIRGAALKEIVAAAVKRTRVRVKLSDLQKNKRAGGSR